MLILQNILYIINIDLKINNLLIMLKMLKIYHLMLIYVLNI